MAFDPQFICCPGSKKDGVFYPCGEVIHIERIGPVGQRGLPDSEVFHCGACGIYFTSSGETWKEAHGHLE